MPPLYACTDTMSNKIYRDLLPLTEEEHRALVVKAFHNGVFTGEDAQKMEMLHRVLYPRKSHWTAARVFVLVLKFTIALVIITIMLAILAGGNAP